MFLSGELSDVRCLCRSSKYELSGENPEGPGAAMTELKENTSVLVLPSLGSRCDLKDGIYRIFSLAVCLKSEMKTVFIFLPIHHSQTSCRQKESTVRTCTCHLALALNMLF